MADINEINLPPLVNYTLWCGDTFRRVFRFFEADGTTPKSIVGLRFKMEFLLKGKKVTAPSALTWDDTPSTGELQITASNELTVNGDIDIIAGIYNADLEATYPDSTVKTFIRFVYTMNQDQTNRQVES